MDKCNRSHESRIMLHWVKTFGVTLSDVKTLSISETPFTHREWVLSIVQLMCCEWNPLVKDKMTKRHRNSFWRKNIDMFSALKCLRSEGSKVSTHNCGSTCFYLGFKTVVFVALPYLLGTRTSHWCYHIDPDCRSMTGTYIMCNWYWNIFLIADLWLVL